jgi:cation diffusion facilitator family transporter
MDETKLALTTEHVRHMRFAIRLSLAIGIFMFVLKIAAYVLTGSAAILSDAAESVVHVLAVAFAAFSLNLSLKPPDESHVYGHDRISFFSAGFEGAMIIIAALYIIYESIMKWIHGLVIDNISTGTIAITLATVINGLLGWYLVRMGKRYKSIVLEANGKHVLTDSWTSLGVIIALILTMTTGWLPFDPIIAILVALNILWSGGKLVRQSVGGLMDETDRSDDATLREVLDNQSMKYGVDYHDLRHRHTGNKLLVEVHLLFSNSVTITQAHDIATRIEGAIHSSFPIPTEVMSHLEPMEGHDEIHSSLLNRNSQSHQ